MQIMGNIRPGSGTSKCKDPEAGAASTILRSSKEACAVGAEGVRRGRGRKWGWREDGVGGGHTM